MTALKRVFLASPFAGEIERNQIYLERALADSFARGEAPLAPHHSYPYVLADSDPAERALGMSAGAAWMSVATTLVVYVDYGVSRGMQAELDLWEATGRECPPGRRTIGVNP